MHIDANSPRVQAAHAAPATNDRYDYVLVGGGLQNGLIALALRHYRPNAAIALVERSDKLGGQHTWCFHQTDAPTAAHSFLAPLACSTWPAHEVKFDNSERTLFRAYTRITSERLARLVEDSLARHSRSRLLLSTEAIGCERDRVVLKGGCTLKARLVVDARGPDRLSAGSAGYQKFLGLELQVRQKTRRAYPLLMDARVSQVEGFRFFYCLPIAEDRVLIEDTYYSDSPDLDRVRLRQEVLRYAACSGYDVIDVVREEQGVLPLPKREFRIAPSAGPLSAGYQGGWFHPTTGYSFPLAVRLALHVASREPDRVFDQAYETMAVQQRRQGRFCVLLNRLLFDAFHPEQRKHVIERFYRMPEDAIFRFYALKLNNTDRARIVCGRPPRGLSVRRALFGGTPA